MSLSERVKAIRPFAESELAALLNASAADTDYHPLFLTLARTGLRPGEAFALRWSDIDFGNREILVERALSAGRVGSTKADSVRRVDMSSELATTLKSLYLRRERESLAGLWSEMPQLVFINGEGNALDESRCESGLLARCAWPS